ncbi:efflux RND transporter periplasmic adaptor subunit [Granulicella sibirica]|nr:efflux RND transporter periplasmic adaptor subunit [Granulicella sibirica]
MSTDAVLESPKQENARQTHLDNDRLDVNAPHKTEGPHVDPPKHGLPKSVWIALVVIAIVVAAVVFFGIASRSSDEKKLATVTHDASVPIVNATHPSVARLAPEISLPGNAQAYVDTPIYARTDGYLKSWYFDIGAHVKKGQLLAVIETPELDQQLQVAQAQLKSSQANLNLANITSERYQNLLKTNSISKQETDQAVSDASAKEAAVDASSAAVRRLQQLQSFERVYAPFDGIVTVRNTDVGQLIQGGSSPTPLFHVAAIGQIRVFVPVPEAYSGAVRDGGNATLTLDEYPGRSFTGVIARNSSAIDPATRTLNVEVDVQNAKAEILPGAYVFVHFKVPDQGESLTLPSNALIFRSAGLQVAVVRDGRVKLVPVTLARDAGAFVEISSGLTSSDLVVLDPSDSLTSGQQVDAKQVSFTVTK